MYLFFWTVLSCALSLACKRTLNVGFSKEENLNFIDDCAQACLESEEQRATVGVTSRFGWFKTRESRVQHEELPEPQRKAEVALKAACCCANADHGDH